ncbi:MAG TPA: hypothetical protein VFN23_20080, partial [Ktedonobacteraceae bacterium]|nr:hypothetical protein [Ktedonobacteraceae bacterium]
GKMDQAEELFQTVMKQLEEQSPGLEYGRALLSYGKLLIQKEKTNRIAHKQGLAYIQQALQIFEEVHAVIDYQIAKQVIENQKK